MAAVTATMSASISRPAAADDLVVRMGSGNDHPADTCRGADTQVQGE